MTKAILHRVGNHLGRGVHCGAVDRVDDFASLVLEHSLVLLDTADSGLTVEGETRLVKELVQLRPLGVFFTGPVAERMFDLLIHSLAVPTNPLPIMTNFSSELLHEAVEAFLLATWPAEEWWERWQGYVLLNVGGSTRQLEEAAKHVLESSGPP